jgi:hypothetical protein
VRHIIVYIRLANVEKTMCKSMHFHIKAFIMVMKKFKNLGDNRHKTKDNLVINCFGANLHKRTTNIVTSRYKIFR